MRVCLHLSEVKITSLLYGAATKIKEKNSLSRLLSLNINEPQSVGRQFAQSITSVFRLDNNFHASKEEN